MTRSAGFRAVSWLVVIACCLPQAWAQRTKLDPGFNLFSPQQDIEMGRQVALEAEEELALIEDVALAEYINRVGQQLATVAPFEPYPYEFSLVNDTAINAFALPGGFIYINRGVLEAADREAEVAGVLGHEIAHVALRHGTNQASKAYIAQAPLAIFGGLLGGGSGVGSILTQLGIGFGANSLFLKFSRDAERQADLLGVQILFDAGYDPTGMTEFFEKLAAEGGSRGSEFFSSHPNPDNRLQDVGAEIQRLGSPPSSYFENFSEFRRVKERLEEVPEAEERREDGTRNDDGGGRRAPEPPSGRYRSYQGEVFRLAYPTNWEVSESEDRVIFAPEGGIAGTDGGLGYGFLASSYEPVPNQRRRTTLEDATDQLIANLREANPSMRIGQGYRRERLAGRTALSTVIRSESRFGGSERDWLITAFGPDARLYYFIGVVPEAQFDTYEETFVQMFDSVRFR